MTKEEQAVIDAALIYEGNTRHEQLKSAIEALKASRITPETLKEYEGLLKDGIRNEYLKRRMKLEIPHEMYSQMYDDAEDEVRAELGMEAINRD